MPISKLIHKKMNFNRIELEVYEDLRFRRKEVYPPVYQGKRLIKRTEIPLCFAWQLFRFNGFENMDIFKLEDPTDLGEGITAQQMEVVLNTTQWANLHCFPKEKDFVIIGKNAFDAPKMYFVFKENCWQFYAHWETLCTTHLLKQGRLVFYSF